MMPGSEDSRARDVVDVARAWRLSEMDLFADLSDAEMQAIAEAAPMREVPRGALLYAPHRPVDVLFIVKAGRVRVYRTAVDGRSLTTAIVTPGQLFGQMPALGQRMDDAYAEMLEAGVLCVMNRSDVQRLLFADARIVARVTALLGSRIAELETRLTDTALKTVPARICSALATIAGSPPTPVRLTHDQIADLVGTTRETTTKVLGDLRDRHYIRLRRGRIDVLDPLAVLELADRLDTRT
ncbi:Crp/Fnr family transcriptional regulator [Kineosporia sp. R_H_3]|uniref:Crp/Fnr family transcriptional regulator n=1 Tax=Kineosporia sp. R_H_3 TaxID=1961848 RepID=UPI0018E9B74A|nr:Crp/Fnr family transcriptional regulator [Kineosporia sp. R_H_3]